MGCRAMSQERWVALEVGKGKKTDTPLEHQ